ncbi:MAG TPA: response regulator transcription factor [Candidatus Baltobacteraceae bacterium]|nr:response regulator transcription factor [Candidatus Baltobacteraceae bacterium]
MVPSLYRTSQRTPSSYEYRTAFYAWAERGRRGTLTLCRLPFGTQRYRTRRDPSSPEPLGRHRRNADRRRKKPQEEFQTSSTPRSLDGRHQSAFDALLSARELQVVRLIAEGLSNKQIGANLELSDKTVKNHISHILAKLGLTARTQVAVLALRGGIC